MPPRKPASRAKVPRTCPGKSAKRRTQVSKLALNLAEKLWKKQFAKTTTLGDNWPTDCVVDEERFCSYLPHGWTLALKKTCNKLLLQCYIGPPPERKRFFHKVDLEKHLGRKLKAGSSLKPRILSKDLQRTFPPESFLQRTEVMGDKPYIDTRCDRLHGLTVGDAIATFMYNNADRKSCHYQAADLRYDVDHGRLKLTETKPHPLLRRFARKAARPPARRARRFVSAKKMRPPSLPASSSVQRKPASVKKEPAVASSDSPSVSSAKRSRSREMFAETCRKIQTATSEGAVPNPPAHWPPLTVVDLRRRSVWLPPDWGQGIKQTPSGGVLTVYISPQGKRYFHKQDIEKQEGIDLSSAEHQPADGAGRPLRWVNARPAVGDAAEVPAHWPDGVDLHAHKRVAWLPPSWGQGWRKTTSGVLRRVYISPAPEGKVMHHRADIERQYFGARKLPHLGLALDGAGRPAPPPPPSRAAGVGSPATTTTTTTTAIQRRRLGHWELVEPSPPSSAGGDGNSSPAPHRPGPKLSAPPAPGLYATGSVFRDSEVPPGEAPRPLVPAEASLKSAFSSLQGRAARGEGDQVTLYALAGFGTARGVDPTVLGALPQALKKEPAERGPLDDLVIKSLEEELARDGGRRGC